MLNLRVLFMALCAVIVLFGVSEAQASAIAETVNAETETVFVHSDYVKVSVIQNTGPLAWLKHKFGKRGACLLSDIRYPSGAVIPVDQYRRYRFDFCLVPKSALSKIDETACSRSRELIAQDRESVKSRKSSVAVIAKSDPPLVRSFEEKTDTPTLRTEEVTPAPEKVEKMEVPEARSRGLEAPAPVVTPSVMPDTIRTVTLKIGEDNQVFTVNRGESIRFILEGAAEDATISIWQNYTSVIQWQQDYEHNGVFVITGYGETKSTVPSEHRVVLYPTNWVGKDAPRVTFTFVIKAS